MPKRRFTAHLATFCFCLLLIVLPMSGCTSGGGGGVEAGGGDRATVATETEIDGTWSGTMSQAGQPDSQVTLTFDAGTYSATTDDQWSRGWFVLRTGIVPKQIDLNIEGISDSDMGGETARGIYELADANRTLRMAFGANGGARPVTLTASQTVMLLDLTHDGSAALLEYEGGANIGMQGGIVKLSDHEHDSTRAYVEIPAGLLASLTYISIQEHEEDPPPCDFSPYLFVDLGPNGQSFAEPVKVALSYPQDADPADFTVYRADSGSWDWTALNTVAMDASARLIVAETDHFSIFALGPKQAYSGASAAC